MNRLESFGVVMLSCIVIAGLALLVTPRIHVYDENAKISRAKADVTSITTAIEMFRRAASTLPTSAQGLEALVIQPAGTLRQNATLTVNAVRWAGPYLYKVPTDPWGHDYIYEFPSRHGQEFDLHSVGKDGLEGTADDITSWGQEP